MNNLWNEGYTRALSLLHQAATNHGLLASVTDESNYRRIWARDSVICGLAGILAEDLLLIETLGRSLETLGNAGGPRGEIPSNVSLDNRGQVTNISYGTLSGRVDSIPWFIIGVYHYVRHTGEHAFAKRMEPAILNGLQLLSCWEFNKRGLVYVPLGGDWADEYILHGYVLYDQVLRFWALQCYGTMSGNEHVAWQADQLREKIRSNYWISSDNRDKEDLYHPPAYRRLLSEKGDLPYWMASLTPGGYIDRFDALANALTIILGMNTKDQQERILTYAESICEQTANGLIPAFWEPITPNNWEWQLLQNNYHYRFRNEPYQYHNGGIWPMVNGWWGLALEKAGESAAAKALLTDLCNFNRQGEADGQWGFYEYGHALTGDPGGTPRMSWSAAAVVMLWEYLEGKRLFTPDN